MTADYDQKIYAADGAEYTYPRTITETTGKDISADVITVGLSDYATPPTVWVAPSVDDAQTDTSTRVVQLLVDDSTPAGSYWLWTKTVDGPETIVRPTIGKITVVNPA